MKRSYFLKTFVILGAIVAAFAPAAHAHFGQRVWVDVDSTGKITTLAGPPGGSPAPYLASQFPAGRVFARDMGSSDINYTTLLGGPLATDNDLDDDGVSYQSNFPGYEATPFPSSSFSGTFNIAFTREVLYYQAGVGGGSGHFVPVSTAFAGKTDTSAAPLPTPYFTIDATVANPNGAGNITYTLTSPSSDAAANPLDTLPAFTVGSHAHPGITLHPNSLDDGYTGSSTDTVVDQDQYDGIYALGLQLSAPGYKPSDTFYLILGKNEPLADIAAAGIVAGNTLIPEPSSMGILLFGGGGGVLLRRRRRTMI